MGISGVKMVDIDFSRILRLCDPRDELLSEEEFISFWSSARSAIDRFLLTHRDPGHEGSRPDSIESSWPFEISEPPFPVDMHAPQLT